MDLFNILGYLNKFSLIAFFATLLILGYQVYLLNKESKKNKEMPVIPDFSDKHQAPPALNFTKIEPLILKKEEGPSKSLLILFGITVFVMILLFFALIFKQSNGNQTNNNGPIVKFIASAGIKIYDSKWLELKDKDLKNLKSGAKIYIGLATIEDKNIDKVRIRVNNTKWTPDDEKTLFDQTKQIFYKDYIVSTDSSALKVEAQFHSSIDGWLGE